MSEYNPKFETVIADGEVSDRWFDVGSNNVVFSLGDTALKVCFSLPNDHLEDPDMIDRLAQNTHLEIVRNNSDADTLAYYFGDILLRSESYAATGDVRGGTVGKMYDDLAWPEQFRLVHEKLYKDVPLMITEQLFFNPYRDPNIETVSFTIGKGDYNHLDSPPDPVVYERMNDVLLRGEKPENTLDPMQVYDVQKSGSLVYYMNMLRTDPMFREMMEGLLPQIARYTHETGGMIDIFPTTTNGLFIKNGNTGKWTPKFYEMSTNKWFGDAKFLNRSRREVLSDPFNPGISDEALQHTDMAMSYMRSLNVLAIECGLDLPFNIFCENGNPNLQPDCQLSPGGWWAVYERIQMLVVKMYGESYMPSYVSIPASVWKGAPLLIRNQL